jgi:tRNA modification GTPase
MNHSGDTISAQATPPGKGGVGIIRVSGPKAAEIANAVLGHCPQTRKAEFLPFLDEQNVMLDQGIALFFKGPNSFTGEDVLELQGHGGQVLMDMLLRRVVAAGSRLAEPGEFSQRAFLNDKIDLAQAEAIADLINSSTEEAARSAMRSLRGDFSQRVYGMVEQLIHLRMYVESAIDFPEEDRFSGRGNRLSRRW